MKNRIISIAMALVALFGVSLTVTAAQSSMVNLAGNEIAEINCDGRRLVVERTSKTQVMATCRPSNDAPTPPDDPAPEPNELAVVSFIWVNADTNQDIGPLTNGSTVNLALMPTSNLKIRAETQPSTVGSVVFAVNSHNFGADNTPPYTLGGDASASAAPLSGQYTLTAVPYEGSNGGGTKGTALTVTFTVVDDDSEPPSDEPPSDEPPSSSVPLCDDHDPNVWHPLYDAEKNCHYDHTHNGNPHDLDYIFGPVGAWHTGQSISYPWHTPNENEIKHEGYKWEAKEVNGCVQEANLNHDTCITAWRIQFHNVGGPVGAVTRIHSYSAEVRVCTEDGSQCGIVKTGGWADFGILEVPYKGSYIPLPSDPDSPSGGFNVHVPPYRGHDPLNEAPKPGFGGIVPVTWNSSGRYGYNQILEFDFHVADDWQGIDPNDPSHIELICPDYQCKYNHSKMVIYEIVIYDSGLPPADENGLINFTGYTDRQGNIVNGCTEVGLDCIPLIFENVPKGTAAMRLPGFPKDYWIEYDTSPPGEWWIEYPN